MRSFAFVLFFIVARAVSFTFGYVSKSFVSAVAGDGRPMRRFTGIGRSSFKSKDPGKL